jgi:tetratricopeptide (TPR) repeat protein
MKKRSACAALLPIALLTSSQAAAAVLRLPGDAQEVDAVRASHPRAVALLEEGETAAAAGDMEGAHALFQQAEAVAPSFALLWRRDCEALSVLDRRPQAVDACSRALQDSRNNVDERALVHALVDGRSAPTTDDLLEALALTSFESRRSPGMSTPAAMACDIAASVGDGLMLQRCAEELERIAPDDPETKRATKLLASQCPAWRFWAGWLAIAAAGTLTMGHALRRVAVRTRGRRTGMAMALLVATMPLVARADEQPATGWLSRWKIDDDHPENSIPSEKERNAEPLEFGYWLQDVVLKAERATKRGDHAAAVKFYLALAKAVPDQAVSFVKLCEECEALGDIDRATSSCADALLRNGVQVKDYTRFAHLVISKPGRLTDRETAALGQVIQHMKDDPAGREAVYDVECEVGVRTSNLAQLRECTAALAARAPEDKETLTYQWALAIQEGHFDQAEKLIERARSAGVSVEAMEHTTATDERRHRFAVTLAIVGVVLLLGGAGVAGRAVARRRRVPPSSHTA